MNKKYLQISILICSCIILLSSCKKEIVYEGLKGDLKGKIYLNDGDVLITDFSGITVTAEGSEPLVKDTTNEKGEYTLKDLETGIYDIVFSKEGFGTYKKISYQFIGGNIATFIGPGSLYRLSDIQTVTLIVDTGRYSPYSFYVNISGTIPVQKTCSFRYYISEDSKVSYLNYQATATISTYNGSSFSNYISSNLLTRFTKGKQLYLIMYPSSSGGNSYLDITSGNQIYDVNPSLGSSVISFKVPETINLY